jgi:hypothetical protein
MFAPRRSFLAGGAFCADVRPVLTGRSVLTPVLKDPPTVHARRSSTAIGKHGCELSQCKSFPFIHFLIVLTTLGSREQFSRFL